MLHGREGGRGWQSLLAAGLMAMACNAQALGPGQQDSFSNSSLDGWSSGANHPAPPEVVTDGGPGGAGDGWLRLTALGGGPGTPGGRLVAFAGPQWLGDYVQAGVTGITMDLRNLGDTDLSLRLAFFSPLLPVYTEAFPLAAGSGWTQAHFSLRPEDMVGPAAEALRSTFQVRLVHQPDLSVPLPLVATVLGVDNVSAVPEPATGALLALGVAALVLLLRRRG